MAPEALKKLSTETRAFLAERIADAALKTFVEKTKAAEDSGEFEVVISTSNQDRAGDELDQSEWDLSFYKANPIVLWAHDYYSLPIGITESIDASSGKLVAKGKFAPASANPFAQQVRQLYDAKIVRATSVGYIPRDMRQDGKSEAGNELLEFSFVPVPANPYALSLREVSDFMSKGLDLAGLATKGISFRITKGVVPADVSDKLAPEDQAWKKPTLEDFTDKAWADLTDAEKKHIAGHYAWAKEEPPATFGDLKLPHHDPKTGDVVWNGVKAAMGALMGARGGVEIPEEDKAKVYEHLAAHYKQFDKKPPEMEKALDTKGISAGDTCQMPDGTAGVMGLNQDGSELVCQPTEAKAADDESNQPQDDQAALREELKAEHGRHMKAVGDIIEKAMAMDNSDDPTDPEGDEKKALILKIGREISGKNKEKLKGMQQHAQAMLSTITELLGNEEGEPDGDEGEGTPSDNDGDEPGDGGEPSKGSKAQGTLTEDDIVKIEKFYGDRRLLKALATAVQEALASANDTHRDLSHAAD